MNRNLLFWLILSFLPGIFGGRYKPGDWYATLSKPPWTPPNIAFPIIWTALYIVIGIAAWLVFREGIADRREALTLFLIQLVLNGLWSWIFFGQHQIGWALLDLTLLWGTVLAMLIIFWNLSPLAGGLMMPYFLWLSIALSLNGFIFLKR